jgi:DNA-binding MarR family transcriptional regulator
VSASRPPLEQRRPPGDTDQDGTSQPAPTRTHDEQGDPGTDPADTDVDDIVTAVLGASRLLVAVSARSLASVEDTLTLPQFRMLVVLDSQGRLSLSRLAENLAVSPSTALRMAERLITIDMLARADHPGDRREVRFFLTAAGRRTVAEVTARRRAEIARIVAAVPPAQRADVVHALRVFTTAGGEPPVSDIDAQAWSHR